MTDLTSVFFDAYKSSLGIQHAEHQNPSDPRYDATMIGVAAVRSAVLNDLMASLYGCDDDPQPGDDLTDEEWAAVTY